MTDKLNALWNAYRETPFLTTGISRKLPELSTNALAGIEALLKTMSDTGETKDGYRVKQVASNLYKLIALQQGDDEKGKGKSLINEKESLTGQICEGFSEHRGENSEIVSFFPKGLDSRLSTDQHTIDNFHRQLRTNAGWKYHIDRLQRIQDEAMQKQEKRSLPAIMVSAFIPVGEPREWNDRRPLQHTGLIQADFDHVADLEAQRLIERLRADPHARLIFRSPRGKAKAFIRVRKPSTVHEHRAAFRAVSDYCVEMGYGEIDEIPKAVNSLCFVSHDPHATLNDAIPLAWDAPPEPTAPPPSKPIPPSDLSNLIRKVHSALDAIPADDYLSHWIEVGCALYHSEIDQETAFAMWDAWSHKSTRYDQNPKQMKKKWDSFATKRDDKHGVRYIYRLARQYGFNPPRDDTPNLRPQRRSTPNLRPRRRNPNLRPRRRNPNLRRHTSKRRSTTP